MGFGHRVNLLSEGWVDEVEDNPHDDEDDNEVYQEVECVVVLNSDNFPIWS